MIDIRTGKQMTRGGFIKGIIASGIAPYVAVGAASLAGSANASVGGMMRNVGARNAAMFGGVWKNPYITDGLVAMLDGEWNAGGGLHDPNVTTWKDLVSNYDLTGYGSPHVTTWGEKCAYFYRNRNSTWYTIDLPFQDIESIEVVLAFDDAGFLPVALSFFDSSSNNGVLQQLKTNNEDGRSIIQNWTTADAIFNFITGYPFTTTLSNATYKNASYVSSKKFIYRSGHSPNSFVLGAHNIRGDYSMYGRIFNVRLYSRKLTEDEIQHNYQVDKARFNLT